MVMIVHCEKCGGTSIPFGTVSVNVEMSKHEKCCEHCNHIRESKQNLFFCSLDCFNEWMADRIADPLEWKNPEIHPTSINEN